MNKKKLSYFDTEMHKMIHQSVESMVQSGQAGCFDLNSSPRVSTAHRLRLSQEPGITTHVRDSKEVDSEAQVNMS